MAEQKPHATESLKIHGRRQLGPRAVLIATFAVLLGLMAIASLDYLRMLNEIETSNARIHGDFLLRERMLEEIRVGLYQSGITVRDYILSEPDQTTSEMLRAELRSTRDAMDGAARKIYSAPVQPAERKSLDRLRVELAGYWSTLDPIFERDEKEKQAQGYVFLRRDVVPQHATVLAILRDISAVNEDELKEGERRVADVLAQFRQRLEAVTAIALGLGVVVAFGAATYTLRLEKRVEQRYRESLQAQQELKELSARLVDTQERERRAISRELHDEVGQSLSALLMDVENLLAMPAGESAFGPGLQNIKTLAGNCVNEVRNMSLLLRPSMLDDLGLAAALDWQAREVSKRTGMHVALEEDRVADTLPEEYRTCVYRIVQEALNNCSRHAHARNVRVAVRQEPQRLLLTIQDDGRGFDPRRLLGLGLVGMTERVNHLGGTLKIESHPESGTLLHVDLPLPAPSTVLDWATS